MTGNPRSKAVVDSRDDDPATPSECPACRSAAITTSARSRDVNAYWRCERCGEVWNASRRAGRPSGPSSWR